MSGKGKARRRMSAEEKLRILEEARAPNTTVAEVLRRHQLEGQVWTATVPLDWLGCPPPARVLGWELALAGAPSGADRAPIALVLPW